MNKTLLQIETEGYEGIDVSLENSLVDYGIAWKQLPGEEAQYFGIGEWKFIYAHPYFRGSFDYAFMREQDIESDFDWVDMQAFLANQGLSPEEWVNVPYPQKIFGLVSYYGPIEVFGESYTEGFIIDGIEHESEAM